MAVLPYETNEYLSICLFEKRLKNRRRPRSLIEGCGERKGAVASACAVKAQ